MFVSDCVLFVSRCSTHDGLAHICAGQAIVTSVEVAGIEPASSGFSVGLLRAQPAVDCRVPFRYRRQVRSVSD
jgi:hypothetical protein